MWLLCDAKVLRWTRNPRNPRGERPAGLGGEHLLLTYKSHTLVAIMAGSLASVAAIQLWSKARRHQAVGKDHHRSPHQTNRTGMSGAAVFFLTIHCHDSHLLLHIDLCCAQRSGHPLLPNHVPRSGVRVGVHTWVFTLR